MAKKDNMAFVMVTTVLATAVVVVVLLIGQLQLATNDAWSGDAWQRAMNLTSLAEGCARLSYRSIELNEFYAGQNLSLGDNLCIIEVLKQSNDYEIEVTASAGEYYKKIKIAASLVAGQLMVNQWQEVE